MLLERPTPTLPCDAKHRQEKNITGLPSGPLPNGLWRRAARCGACRGVPIRSASSLSRADRCSHGPVQCRQLRMATQRVGAGHAAPLASFLAVPCIMRHTPSDGEGMRCVVALVVGPRISAQYVPPRPGVSCYMPAPGAPHTCLLAMLHTEPRPDACSEASPLYSRTSTITPPTLP